MPFIWTTIQCGKKKFKYLPQLQAGTGDCAPTSVAMLVWNLGYGMGFESLAIRSGVYAQQHAGSEQKREASQKANCLAIGLWGRLVSGMSRSEEMYMLDSYGLRFEIYYERSSSHGRKVESRGTAVTQEQRVEYINGLGDGEGALVCGVADGGGRHAIPIVRRGGIVVALDRIEANLCWVNVDTHQKIAKLDNDKILITGMFPGEKYKQAKKGKRNCSLEVVDAVFIIRQQSLIKTWGNVFTNTLSTMHHYFY